MSDAYRWIGLPCAAGWGSDHLLRGGPRCRTSGGSLEDGSRGGHARLSLPGGDCGNAALGSAEARAALEAGAGTGSTPIRVQTRSPRPPRTARIAEHRANASQRGRRRRRSPHRPPRGRCDFARGWTCRSACTSFPQSEAGSALLAWDARIGRLYGRRECSVGRGTPCVGEVVEGRAGRASSPNGASASAISLMLWPPIRRRLRQGSRDHRVDGLRHARPGRMEARRLVGHDRRASTAIAEPLNGVAPERSLVEDDAQRPDIGARASTFFVDRTCSSGGHVEGVPIEASVDVAPTSISVPGAIFEMPKSRTLRVTVSPSRARKRFEGLRSRWMMPLACASDIVLAARITKLTASATGSGPRSSASADRSWPSRNSITMKGTPSAETSSVEDLRRVCAPELLQLHAPRAGIAPRAPDPPRMCGRSILMATRCPIFWSGSPRKRPPYLPCRSRSQCRYLPLTVSPGRGSLQLRSSGRHATMLRAQSCLALVTAPSRRDHPRHRQRHTRDETALRRANDPRVRAAGRHGLAASRL